MQLDNNLDESIELSNEKTIPLYAQVKEELYMSSTVLSNYNSLLQTSKGFDYGDALILFKEAFHKLYFQINDKKKIGLLDDEQRKYLNYYYENPERIRDTQAKKITEIIRIIIDKLDLYNITKPQGENSW